MNCYCIVDFFAFGLGLHPTSIYDDFSSSSAPQNSHNGSTAHTPRCINNILQWLFFQLRVANWGNCFSAYCSGTCSFAAPNATGHRFWSVRMPAGICIASHNIMSSNVPDSHSDSPLESGLSFRVHHSFRVQSSSSYSSCMYRLFQTLYTRYIDVSLHKNIWSRLL